MKYFKVRNTSGNVLVKKPIKSWYLISNELITMGELKREKLTNSFISAHFETKEVSKNKTYFCFGARFENKL